MRANTGSDEQPGRPAARGGRAVPRAGRRGPSPCLAGPASARTRASPPPPRSARAPAASSSGRRPGLDVAQVEVGEARVQQDRAAEQEQDEPWVSRFTAAPPRPATDTTTASTNVAGANRSAKPRPNVPACIANSFRSTIGPTTRNASLAVSENCVSDAATNASASEQIDSSTASTARARTDSTGLSATALSHSAGTTALSVAAAIAPTTRKPPGVQHVVPHRAPERRSPCSGRRTTGATAGAATPRGPTAATASPSRRPRAGSPTNRASTISRLAGERDGGRGQHDRVDRGRRQQERQRRGRGDAAPDQRPGHRHRRALAAGQHRAGHAGDRHGEGRAAWAGPGRRTTAGRTPRSTADSSTPRTRNGSAWTMTATNTVIQLCMAGADSARRIGLWRSTSTTKSMVRRRGS